MLAAILLAAGGSSRFGRANKLLVLWRGRPLIDHALDRMIALPAARLIVVTGADRARIERIVRHRRDRRVATVHNPRWRDGMGGSIARALARTAPADRLLLFLLADMPMAPVPLGALARTVRNGAAAARPAVGGRPGHPVMVRRSAVATIGRIGDRGLWPMLAARGAPLATIAGAPGAECDVDDRVALRALRLRGSGRFRT